MRPYTDSEIVEYNEDGSRTVTTVQTFNPASKKDKALGLIALGVLAASATAPLAIAFVADRWTQRQEARKANESPQIVTA